MHVAAWRGGPATTAPESGRQHVLVVDDSEEFLALLRDLLEDEGYRVTTSLDPIGTATVAQIAPDAVVLDILFGSEQRGLDLLRQLREAPATAATPVVLCSAAIEPIRRIDGELLGETTGLVLKPFDIDGLVAEIERVLGASGEPDGRRGERW
jgi:CheY-like chemotaxis protein